MTEGEKKRIYYELRNNDVRVGKTQNFGTTYTFGHYRVTDHFDYIYISKSHKNRPGIFVIMRGEDWGDVMVFQKMMYMPLPPLHAINQKEKNT